MKVRPWRELERELPTRVRARVTARVEAELLAMDLRAIRAQLGKTQAEIAEALGSSQSRVSDLERQGDHRLSTLRPVGTVTARRRLGRVDFEPLRFAAAVQVLVDRFVVVPDGAAAALASPAASAHPAALPLSAAE
jgi:predicted XRE-type DNA-binding protein